MTRALVHGETGISLVEVMVSITIIAVALLAFASTATQSLANITEDEQFVRANQIASELIERLRAAPWDQVGFYADDAGYSASASDGAPTVNLGPSRPAGDNGLRPTQTIDRGGITYLVEVDIVWMDDPNTPAPPAFDPNPNDYKELRTSLSWTVRDQRQQLDQTATRRPTLDEVPLEEGLPCPPGDIIDFRVSPDLVTLSSGGSTLDAVSVTVETCTESSTVTLSPPSLSNRALSEVPGSGGKEWTTDFPVGTAGFSIGTFTWSVASIGTHGTASADLPVQFVEESAGEVLQVLSLDVTPAICVANDRRPHVPVTLTAAVDGGGASDLVTFSWTANSGSSSGSSAGESAGVHDFRGVIPTSAQLTDATTTITVSVTRNSDGVNATETFVVPVATRTFASGCP